jgi:hypothetical protein
MMKFILLVTGLVLALSQVAVAQAPDPATREIIDKLLERIDTLEKRVNELEKEKTAGPAPPAVPAAANALPRPAEPQAHDHDQVILPEALELYPALKITGFSDVSFAATDLQGASGGFGNQTLLGAKSGFQEGQFILHFSSALSPKVSVFSELSLTARPDAGTGTPAATGFNAEVERVIIRYDLNDRFKLSFGRYHTPINYWNAAYHHGAWLQTTISRPEMVQFGASFLPIHFVGALAEGRFRAGGLNLNYTTGIGNGRSSILGRGGDFGDVNNNRAWLAGFFIQPESLYGLQIGGSIYRDKLNPATGPVTREWIQSGHIVWQRGSTEFLAEVSNVAHKSVADSSTSNSQAFYVQPAYRLPVDEGKWKPYYRFEYTHIPLSDPLFRAVPSYNGSTVGTRYDISRFAAFKLEYRLYNRRSLPRINGIFMQTSFTF